MSLTQWLTGGADEQARKLCAEFAQGFPAAMEAMSNRKSIELRDRAIVGLLHEAMALQREKRMGMLRKIIFARRFQAELNKAGYSPAFVRQLMSELLAKVAFANR